MSYLAAAEAPSNIALVKYMGKMSTTENRPANASLSWTTEHLRSKVAILDSIDGEDSWGALVEDGWTAPELTVKGQQRFLKHFRLLKDQWGVEGKYKVLSANNFPSDCGIASSASSFAALTLASWYLAKAKIPDLDATQIELSALSRQGSGSSCRSLFSPWAIWKDSYAEPVSGLLEGLEHQVVIVSDEKKEVSSSEAHKRVTTSSFFEGRVKRAENRLENLLRALSLESSNWKQAFEICLEEFEDMHQLFETSEPPFRYRTTASQSVVDLAKQMWVDEGIGPIVTMDAGANVHLLWKPEQLEQARRLSQACPVGSLIVSSPRISKES